MARADGIDVECLGETPLSRRIVRGVISSPRSVLLVALGLGVLAGGIFATSDTAGTGLIVVGAGVACLGILLPGVRESQIGPGGFTLKTGAPPPDERFAVFSQHELEHTQRLALFLTGDSGRSAELASDAFARAFANWNSVGSLDPTRYVICIVTRLALAAQTLHLVPNDLPTESAAAGELVASLGALLSIPPRARAVALLHYYEVLSDAEIASILQESADQVQAHLREAEDLLTSLADPTAAGA
jgi:DNA-directed RNA polymerase specialized sigma24 family protein